MSYRSSFLVPVALAAIALSACNPGTFVVPNPNAVLPASVAPIATPSAPVTTPAAPLPTAPPWNAPEPAWDYIIAAGLEPEAREMLAYHTHSHLAVYYNGAAVVVPANIGIGPNAAYISWLHTHDATGLVHVEAPAATTLTLGQFFKEWNVSLAGAAGFDNGNPVPDVAKIPLVDGHQLVVVYGTPPATIPTRYENK